jgi:membrane protein implicated in regulation of membrane protease activity
MTPALPEIFWAVGGLLLMIAELVAPGVYLLWIGLAALLTALLTLLVEVSLEMQVACFSLSAIATCIAGWRIYRTTRLSTVDDATLNEPNLRLVGQEGEVAEPLRHGHGRVRLGDTLWLAEGPDLDAGRAVRVRSVSGTTLVVEPVD